MRSLGESLAGSISHSRLENTYQSSLNSRSVKTRWVPWKRGGGRGYLQRPVPAGTVFSFTERTWAASCLTGGGKRNPNTHGKKALSWWQIWQSPAPEDGMLVLTWDFPSTIKQHLTSMLCDQPLSLLDLLRSPLHQLVPLDENKSARCFRTFRLFPG